MKLYIRLIVLVVLFTNSVQACDFCNIYLNISPEDYRHSIGLHIRSRTLNGTLSSVTYRKHISHDGSWIGEITDNYLSFELRGNYFLTEKLIATGILPYAIKTRKSSSKSLQLNGASDPTILLNYQLFNTKCLSDEIKFVHRLMIGIGLKFPLGAFTLNDQGGLIADHDLQPGSGSFDGRAQFTYSAKRGKIGSQISAYYLKNGKNKADYQHGTAYTIRPELFYQPVILKNTATISIGYAYEKAKEDLSSSQLLSSSGGKIQFISTGISYYLKNWQIESNYFIPIKNELNGFQLPVKRQFRIGVTKLF